MSASSPQRLTAVTDEHLQRLAVFPLGNVVLLPHAILPLNIFEPRYRQMVEHALERRAPIAIARINPAAASGRTPALHPIVGVGTVLRSDRLDDGRFQLLLRGAGRARIVQEHEPLWKYREFQVDWATDEIDDESACEERQQELREVLRAMTTAQPSLATVFARLAAMQAPPAVYADLVGEVIVRQDDERAQLMDTLNVHRRLEQLIDRACVLLANAPSPRPSGSQMN
jgi:hypothetical protein